MRDILDIMELARRVYDALRGREVSAEKNKPPILISGLVTGVCSGCDKVLDFKYFGPISAWGETVRATSDVGHYCKNGDVVNSCNIALQGITNTRNH